jgi:hypothetical protein
MARGRSTTPFELAPQENNAPNNTQATTSVPTLTPTQKGAATRVVNKARATAANTSSSTANVIAAHLATINQPKKRKRTRGQALEEAQPLSSNSILTGSNEEEGREAVVAASTAEVDFATLLRLEGKF